MTENTNSLASYMKDVADGLGQQLGQDNIDRVINSLNNKQLEIAEYDDFTKEMLTAVYNNMVEAGKNIPFNRAQVKALPVGFTPTSVFPTKSYNQGGRSKYFLPKTYPHLNNVLNFKSLINKINLEDSN
jgi:hypothetical protein